MLVGGMWALVAALVTLFFLDLSDEHTGKKKAMGKTAKCICRCSVVLGAT